jgi:hypothetical protein
MMAGAYARRAWAPDYPWGMSDVQFQAWISQIGAEWGGPVGIEIRAKSMLQDEGFRRWFARYARMGASPAAAVALVRMIAEIDIRDVLPTIRVPTLILHSVGDGPVDVSNGRYLAERIPGAKYVELPGPDHLPWLGDGDAIVSEIAEFLTGVRPMPEPDRVLATVLFTDIVGSTEKAAALGDRRWRSLLDRHNALVRRELASFRGREIDAGATVSLPPSMDLPAPYAAHARSRTKCARSASTCEPVSIRASAKSWVTTLAGSQFTSALA